MTLSAAVALSVVGCDDSGDDPSKPSPSKPTSRELPPLELRDGMKNLLLTWVDDQGEFHVVQKIADVPEEHREQVRVVVTDREEGTGELLYVADLRKKSGEGAYAVKTMARAQWDEIGADRRKARLEALAPGKVDDAREDDEAAGKLEAIVYGADWCKPCHEAKRYLKSRGVAVVEKDIEESQVARKEMQQKLAKANRRGASIPVIDVGGQVLVGFSPRALDRAIDAARSSKAL